MSDSKRKEKRSITKKPSNKKDRTPTIGEKMHGIRARQRQARFDRLAEVEAEVKANPQRHVFEETGEPRPPSIVAMEIVAAEEGISLATIRQQQRRARRTSERLADRALGRPPVETLGIQQDPGHMAIVKDAITLIKKAGRACITACRHLEKARAEHSPLPVDEVTELRDKLSALSNQVFALIPTHVCPWCKGLAEHSTQCRRCRTTGVVSTETFRSAPQKLRDPEARIVMARGRYVDVSDHEETSDEVDELDDLWDEQ